jgi:inosine/xanthosine triphosphate pyrophosphatase family protein
MWHRIIKMNPQRIGHVLFLMESLSENMGMAELSDEKKGEISHRAKSLNKVLEWIKSL